MCIYIYVYIYIHFECLGGSRTVTSRAGNPYIYVYVYIYICVYIYMYIYTFVWSAIYIHICINIYIHIYIYIYIYVHIYIYIHICIYICTQIHLCRVPCKRCGTLLFFVCEFLWGGGRAVTASAGTHIHGCALRTIYNIIFLGVDVFSGGCRVL